MEADLHADPDWEGWPGRLHSGVLYTAMLETANWTIFGLRGRIGLPVTTGALDLRHWVATDTLLRLTGRLDTPDGDSPRARVEAHDAAGLVATLERAYILPTERVFLERMGYSTLPEAFKGLLGDE